MGWTGAACFCHTRTFAVRLLRSRAWDRSVFGINLEPLQHVGRASSLAPNKLPIIEIRFAPQARVPVIPAVHLHACLPPSF